MLKVTISHAGSFASKVLIFLFGTHVFCQNTETGVLGDWSDWSDCDCATSTRQRTRTCFNSSTGSSDCSSLGELSESTSCTARDGKHGARSFVLPIAKQRVGLVRHLKSV